MFQVVDDLPVGRRVEFIEKKGRGHPDSLADALAEIISYEYARYCLDNFGAVLHHYVDKLTLLGGEARAVAGGYEQIRPFRVLLNGRFSRSFGERPVPVVDIAREAIRGYLPVVLPAVRDTYWEIIDNTNPAKGSSAKGWHWWAPRDLNDIPDLRVRRANDTSVSVASSPYTPLEAAVMEAERVLFEDMVRDGRCGSDIKIMASRLDASLHVTACVPVSALAVAGRDDYDTVKAEATAVLAKIFEAVDGVGETRLDVNTRDDVAEGDIYLLGLGSALEHGDEGVVGRGNRANGLITTETPMSIDAPWGKNPVYFTGRVYDGCARAISDTVESSLGLANTTYLASQNGRVLSDPWRAVVRVPATVGDPGAVAALARERFLDGLRLGAQLEEIRVRYPHLPEAVVR